MAVAQAADVRLRVGQVVQRTVEILGRKAGLFLLMALAINVPLALLQVGIVRIELGDEQILPILGAAIAGGLGGLLYLLGYVVLQAAIIHATVADLNGRSESFAKSLSVGLREFFPLLGLGILAALGMALGFVALIIPCFILMTMWAVVVPVRVVEHAGIFDSFGRSRSLTRGSRWSIFLLFVILFVLQMIVVAVVSGFGAAFGGIGPFTQTPPDPSSVLLFPVILNMVSNTIGSVAQTALLAALYYELRVLKEGIGPEALASVFD